VGTPDAAKERGLKVHEIQTRPDATRLRALAQAFSVGELVIPIAQRFALAQIRDAHRAVESQGECRDVQFVHTCPRQAEMSDNIKDD
jgi:hypothetical protein